VRDAVTGPRLADTGWFDAATLDNLVRSHQNGSSDHSAPLWTLMMFEAFLRKVVDGDGAAAPQGAAELAATA
jgi:asparagine synthase (glutamine-hydrolysing)